MDIWGQGMVLSFLEDRKEKVWRSLAGRSTKGWLEIYCGYLGARDGLEFSGGPKRTGLAQLSWKVTQGWLEIDCGYLGISDGLEFSGGSKRKGLAQLSR